MIFGLFFGLDSESECKSIEFAPTPNKTSWFGRPSCPYFCPSPWSGWCNDTRISLCSFTSPHCACRYQRNQWQLLDAPEFCSPTLHFLWPAITLWQKTSKSWIHCTNLFFLCQQIRNVDLSKTSPDRNIHTSSLGTTLANYDTRKRFWVVGQNYIFSQIVVFQEQEKQQRRRQQCVIYSKNATKLEQVPRCSSPSAACSNCSIYAQHCICSWECDKSRLWTRHKGTKDKLRCCIPWHYLRILTIGCWRCEGFVLGPWITCKLGCLD